ncbi:MAG: hypothetical protein ACREC3_04385 [Methyloceanibacter sp.]
MPSSVTMTDRQHVAAGISLLDADGQPFTEVPPGVSVSFSSSDPTVADFVVGPDGFNGDVTSGLVGSAIITALVVLPDLTELSDTLAVAVINSAPGTLSFTVGVPVDET